MKIVKTTDLVKKNNIKFTNSLNEEYSLKITHIEPGELYSISFENEEGTHILRNYFPDETFTLV